MRAAGTPPVHIAGRGQDGGLQLHRGVLQSRPSPFWHPLSIPNRLRDADAQGDQNDLSDKPSTKPGQLQLQSVGSYTTIGTARHTPPAGEHQRPRRRKRSMGLTLEEANRILSSALAKAQELNIKISASVCDTGGRSVAFQSMDTAIWASAYASQGKAVASAAFGRPSGEMAERADQPTPRGVAAAEGGHMIMGEGAVPIIRKGSSRAPAASAAAPLSRTK